MILREYALSFGGRETDILSSNFKCIVTTAKTSIFKGLSTIVAEGDFAFGGAPRAKITYSRGVSSHERREVHDLIVARIDNAGEQGYSLRQAIQNVSKELQNNKVVLRLIHLS
jgi:hypothetical protein